MADTTTYSGQRVDELLRCPVCLDRFNHPKILPCQHTFCHSPCLQGLVDMRTRRLKCPECRAEHTVPYNGADGFPNNLIISNFLDIQPETAARPSPAPPSGSTGSCAICEKSAETSKCGHCDKHLCGTCCKSHYTQLKFDVGRLVNQIRKGIPKLSESLAQVEQKGEQVKQHVQSVKSEVRDSIARYVTQLKDREKMLNSELDTFLQGELRNLRLKQENIEVELASISSYCDSTEGVLNRSGGDMPMRELTAMKEQCMEYKDQIRDADTPASLETKLVNFEADGQNLIAGITNLGSLVVTTPGQTTSRSTSREPTNSTRTSTNQTSPVRRSRWSAPQPLHELYTRDANTPPPPATPPTNMSRNTPAAAASTTPGTARHNQSRNINNWSNTARNPAMYSSPIPSNPASHTFYNRMNDASYRQANAPNTSNYMFRMDTTGDRNPFLEQYRASPGSILSIGTNISPRRSTPSSVFGAYSPGRIPEERAIGIIPGLNRPDIPEDEDVPTSGGDTGFNSRSSDVSTAASVSNPARAYDSRPAIAFSVDLDGEESAPAARRRGRRPPRLNRGRGRGGRSNTSGSNNRSTDNTGESAPASPPLTHRVRGPPRSEEPQPSTSSGPVEDSGVIPVYRSRTFVLDGSNNHGNNNNNSNNQSSENVPSTSTEAPADQNPPSSESDLIIWQDESLTATASKNKYEKKSRVCKIIGSSKGNQPGHFTWPRGVTVSQRTKQILVADSSNHRVQIFDDKARYINQFGSFGTAAGEFDCLAGITCTDSGDIVIADRYNHRVQVFDRQGHLQKVFGREGIGNGQLSYPWGIALDSKKNVYVVDKENHRIQVFTWEGTFLRSISGFGEVPGRLRHPSYVAVAPDNRVIVSDTENNRIQIFTSTGQHLTSFGSQGSEKGQLRSPKGIAVDKQGFIIVADGGNSRVQVFRGNGQHFCMFGSYGRAKGQFKGLEGLALAPDGNIVISDKETHKVQVF